MTNSSDSTAALTTSTSSLDSNESSVSTVSSTKKSVSFPDNVVSEIHSVERNDESLNEVLYYSQDDFQRFKLERRQLKTRTHRMSATRSASRRRGSLYYDNLMLGRKGCVQHQMTVIHMNGLIRLEPVHRMQAFWFCICFEFIDWDHSIIHLFGVLQIIVIERPGILDNVFGHYWNDQQKTRYIKEEAKSNQHHTRQYV